MLWYGRNNWDMNFCVTSVPQRVESAAPGCNVAGICEHDDSEEYKSGNRGNSRVKYDFDIRASHKSLNISQEGISVEQRKNSSGCHMLTSSYWLETNERNLHRKQCSQNVESCVCYKERYWVFEFDELIITITYQRRFCLKNVPWSEDIIHATVLNWWWTHSHPTLIPCTDRTMLSTLPNIRIQFLLLWSRNILKFSIPSFWLCN